MNSRRKHLDFSRPTFNVEKMEFPIIRDSIESVDNATTGSIADADDEDSRNDPALSIEVNQTETEKINVYLRLRPASEMCALYDFDYNENKVIVQHENQNKNVEKHFKFSTILNESVNQVDAYNEIVRPTIANPFELRGATFASYGVSSSGKTHTMLGSEHAGLVPRAITQIFTEYRDVITPIPCAKLKSDQIAFLNDEEVAYELDALENYVQESTKMNKGKVLKISSYENIPIEHNFKVKEGIKDEIDRLYIWISFVEIYNENLIDLLNNQSKSAQPLKIYSNNGSPYIPSLTWLYASNIEDALKILAHGLCKVHYAATGIHKNSSRSHTIFTINMIAAYNTEFQLTSFKFCDLAGAEKVKKTGNVGDRLKEAGGINTSLHVLGRCLENIQHNQSKISKKIPDQIVPVRNSKLTTLLQSSLLGNEKFVMIVSLYPTLDFFDENLNVLKFGSIANQIVMRKSEARVFMRQSFSYVMQHQMNNSIMKNTSINGTIDEDDESALEESFQWSHMDSDQLMHVLHQQKREIAILKDVYCEMEKNHREIEVNLRREAVVEANKMRDMMEERNKENKELTVTYYEKKLQSLKITYERKLSEAFEEIEYLNKQLNKYMPSKQESDDYDDDDDDELIEIDE